MSAAEVITKFIEQRQGVLAQTMYGKTYNGERDTLEGSWEGQQTNPRDLAVEVEVLALVRTAILSEAANSATEESIMISRGSHAAG
jgi:hypothetical protein